MQKITQQQKQKIHGGVLSLTAMWVIAMGTATVIGSICSVATNAIQAWSYHDAVTKATAASTSAYQAYGNNGQGSTYNPYALSYIPTPNFSSGPVIKASAVPIRSSTIMGL